MTETGPLSVFAAGLTLWALLLNVSSVEEADTVVFSPEHYSETNMFDNSEVSTILVSFEDEDFYDPVWDLLADCESGNRNADGDVVVGTARWWYGDPSQEHPSWGYQKFHGGLQFLPATWSWVAPMVLEDPSEFAWQANKDEQIAVAIRTQELQGWEAWPNCSRKVGLIG